MILYLDYNCTRESAIITAIDAEREGNNHLLLSTYKDTGSKILASMNTLALQHGMCEYR